MEPDLDALIDQLCLRLSVERTPSRIASLSRGLSSLLHFRNTQIAQRRYSMDEDTLAVRISALCQEISAEGDYSKVVKLSAQLQKLMSIRDRLGEEAIPDDAVEDDPRTGTLDS